MLKLFSIAIICLCAARASAANVLYWNLEDSSVYSQMGSVYDCAMIGVYNSAGTCVGHVESVSGEGNSIWRSEYAYAVANGEGIGTNPSYSYRIELVKDGVVQQVSGAYTGEDLSDYFVATGTYAAPGTKMFSGDGATFSAVGAPEPSTGLLLMVGVALLSLPRGDGVKGCTVKGERI